MDPKALLWIIAVPALVAGIVLFVGWKVWLGRGAVDREHALPHVGPGAIALAVGLGYLLGHWGLLGGPSSSSDDQEVMLMYLAAGATVVGLLGGLARALPGVLAWSVRLAWGALVGWLLVSPLSPQAIDKSQVVIYSAAASVAIFALWTLFDRVAEAKPLDALLAVMAMGTIGSVTVLLSAYANIAQASGALLTTLGAALVLAWFVRGRASVSAAAPIIATVLVGHWLLARSYAEMPIASFVLLLIAGLGFGLALLLPLAKLPRLVATLILVACVSLPALGAAGLAAQSYFADEAPSGASDAASDGYGYD